MSHTSRHYRRLPDRCLSAPQENRADQRCRRESGSPRHGCFDGSAVATLASRKIPDQARHHWFDEAGCRALFHDSLLAHGLVFRAICNHL
jgi:hypothetical protein